MDYSFKLILSLFLSIFFMTQACSPKKEIAAIDQKYQFLITLDREVSLDKLLSKYTDYNFTNVRQVSKSENMHMFDCVLNDNEKIYLLKELESQQKIQRLTITKLKINPPSNSTNSGYSKTTPVNQ